MSNNKHMTLSLDVYINDLVDAIPIEQSKNIILGIDLAAADTSFTEDIILSLIGSLKSDYSLVEMNILLESIIKEINDV